MKTKLESGDKIFVDRVPYDELNAQRTYGDTSSTA